MLLCYFAADKSAPTLRLFWLQSNRQIRHIFSTTSMYLDKKETRIYLDTLNTIFNEHPVHVPTIVNAAVMTLALKRRRLAGFLKTPSLSDYIIEYSSFNCLKLYIPLNSMQWKKITSLCGIIRDFLLLLKIAEQALYAQAGHIEI